MKLDEDGRKWHQVRTRKGMKETQITLLGEENERIKLIPIG